MTYLYIVIYPTCFSQDVYIYTAFSVLISKSIFLKEKSKLNNTNKDNISNENRFKLNLKIHAIPTRSQPSLRIPQDQTSN
jgi:hypothetical protein